MIVSHWEADRATFLPQSISGQRYCIYRLNFHCSLMPHFLGILHLGPQATQTHLENHRSVSCLKLCHGFLTPSLYTIGKLLALLFKIRFHIDPLEAQFPLRTTEQFQSTGKWLFSVSYIILDELTSSMQLLPPTTSASLCQPEPPTFWVGVFASSTVFCSTVHVLLKHSLHTWSLC